MNVGQPVEIDRFVAKIERDDVKRFAASVGYDGDVGSLAPPTYPIRLLANSRAADHLRTLAATEGGAPVQVSQSFDYARRLRIGEEVHGCLRAGHDGQGARRLFVFILTLTDSDGRAIGHAESRFAIARTQGG